MIVQLVRPISPFTLSLSSQTSLKPLASLRSYRQLARQLCTGLVGIPFYSTHAKCHHPPGHKIATRAIALGEHVHTHKLNMGAEKGNFERDFVIGQDIRQAGCCRTAPSGPTFAGLGTGLMAGLKLPNSPNNRC